AVDFSSAGGVVSVRLQIEGAGACFVVEDQGPGLPGYAVGRVFERFYSLPRPSSGKKSSGLGLCFVREAALLHSGTVAIKNQDGDRGARAVFTLPLESSRVRSETKLPLAQRTPRGTIRPS
ncbi:MAG: ATP-binding protein, partial [Roseimicrobium sp.]